MTSENSRTDLHPNTPTTQLLRMTTGHWVAQSVYVAAKLGIADRIESKSKSAAELASETTSNPDILYRLLRMLSRVGVFSENEKGEFGLTSIGECLRTGSPGTLRTFSIAMGEELYRAWGDPMHSVKTGGSAFEYVFGSNPFEYRASRPEAAATFNQAMTEWSNEATAALRTAYDFTQFSTIADVGGGFGIFLLRLLQINPMAKGTLFELPYVATGAQEQIQRAGFANRCEIVAGDIFVDSLPKGMDAYILKNTVESFDNPRTEALLTKCRDAMGSHSKLLIVGWVIRREAHLAFGDLFDTHLFVALGGRIRTESEYQDLFRRTDLKLSKFIPTNSAMGESILECVLG